MTGLASKDIARLLDHIEPQGVNVTQTKKGYLLRLPDGSTTMVHKTTSDVNAGRKLRSTLHRAGVSTPRDATTDTFKPSPETIRRGLDAWKRLGSPTELRAAELRLAAGWPAKNRSAASWLTWAGFGMVGNTRAARWVLYEPHPDLGIPVPAPDNVTSIQPAPAEDDREVTHSLPAEVEVPVVVEPVLVPAPEPEPEEAPAPEPQPEPEPVPAPEEVPAPEPEPQPSPEPPAPVVDPDSQPVPDPEPGVTPAPEQLAGLAASWRAWEDLPGDWTIDQVRLMLLAFGLDAELRVWRA